MHLVARRATDLGVEIDGAVRFRLDQAVARKDAIVSGIHKTIHGALSKRRDAIDFVRGEARFVSPHEIDTGDRRISFTKAIIATGARRVVPPISGLEAIDSLNNDTALHLGRVPSSLLVIGGGYVGIEFAQMYSRFGSRVTLLGRNDRLAPGEDPQLSELLADYLREEGINVRTGAAVQSIRDENGQKIAVCSTDGSEKEYRAAEVLVAAGRVGNTGGLHLRSAGIDIDARGFIPVDGQLRTSQPHVWAIGDVKGGWMFTHVATYDGPLAALNAVKGLGKEVDYRVVPRAIFSDPTLAAVGLTEAEARESGHDVAVGTVRADGARAKTIGDPRGLLKAVVDRESRQILGFHILAPHGDDLLHEAVAAMHGNGRIDRISKSIHAHPTLSEMVKGAARAAR